MVTEKTFGAIAGLLFEGGVGLGESACGGHGLGEMDQKYITPGDSVGLSESRLESRDTRGREAHQSSDKMPVRGRDRDNQIKVTGRGTSLSDILYSFSRERPPAQTPTHDAPRCPSTSFNRLSPQPAFFSTAHPTLSRWSLPFSRSFHALVTPPHSRSRPSSRCHKRRLLGYHLRR